jgi:hypothetical protein
VADDKIKTRLLTVRVEVIMKNILLQLQSLGHHVVPNQLNSNLIVAKKLLGQVEVSYKTKNKTSKSKIELTKLHLTLTSMMM